MPTPARLLAAIVVERDGLVAFGRVLRHIIRDGYRWQLRWAPWSYGAMYWLGTRVPPGAPWARACCQPPRSGACA